MPIHSGKYLKIDFIANKNRFIQFWHQSPPSFDAFKSEMLAYTELYLKHRPTQSMWLQQNFKLDLDETAQQWIEEKVNVPCKAAGNKQLAFVISQDILAHMKVIGAFEKIKSCITPHHFATQEGAEKWLDTFELPSKSEHQDMSITYLGTDENGLSELTIKTKSGEILEVIRLFDSLMEESKFVKSNIQKYLSLTEREREVLQLRSTGLQLSEVAEKLHISLFTGQTHWRKVKKKLGISTVVDAAKFVKAFG